MWLRISSDKIVLNMSNIKKENKIVKNMLLHYSNPVHFVSHTHRLRYQLLVADILQHPNKDVSGMTASQSYFTLSFEIATLIYIMIS